MIQSNTARTTSVALIAAASFYSLALCWLFTHGAPVTNTIVAIVDGAIILAALAFVIFTRPGSVMLPLMTLALNFLLIALLSQQVDFKSVRDALAIIAFLALGATLGDARSAHIAFFVIAAVVLGLGVFEFIAPKQYTANFNVLQFYIMRGLVDPQVSTWSDTSLFVSGMRGGARNLLPMLGPHRVSSIFMEPVSMGNYGAIAIAWALSLRRVGVVALTAGAVGVIAIIMADARFAAIAAAVFVLVRFVPLAWSRFVLVPLPFLAIGMLMVCSATLPPIGDDLPSRLSISGGIIANLSPAELFGMAPGGPNVVDSGYAYALTAFGLPFCVAAWLTFAWLPTPGVQSARFKLLVGFYICALLCVSGSSLFAIKTSALLWFLLGALMAAERVSPRVAARAQPNLAPARVTAPAHAT